jgi:hypothetical protein
MKNTCTEHTHLRRGTKESQEGNGMTVPFASSTSATYTSTSLSLSRNVLAGRAWSYVTSWYHTMRTTGFCSSGTLLGTGTKSTGALGGGGRRGAEVLQKGGDVAWRMHAPSSPPCLVLSPLSHTSLPP